MENPARAAVRIRPLDLSDSKILRQPPREHGNIQAFMGLNIMVRVGAYTYMQAIPVSAAQYAARRHYHSTQFWNSREGRCRLCGRGADHQRMGEIRFWGGSSESPDVLAKTEARNESLSGEAGSIP